METSTGGALLRRQSYREACPVDRGRDATGDIQSPVDIGSADSGFQELDVKEEELNSEETSSTHSSDSENGFLGFLRTIITNVPSSPGLSAGPDSPTPSNATLTRTSTSLADSSTVVVDSSEGTVRSAPSPRFTLRRGMTSGSVRRVGPSELDSPIDLAPIPEHEVLSVTTSSSPPPPNPPTPTTTAHSASRQSSNVTGNAPQEENEEERAARVGGFWPHSPSSLLATFTCCVGMCDIGRFSYLSYMYGGGFILQFLMLTVIFGLPMLSFQMSVGTYMGAGPMDMWTASPIFLGVGISAILAMASIGIYDVMPISYMFVYFRDSFATGVTFKWGDCRNAFPLDDCERIGTNYSEVIRTSVPAYFQNRVLQRLPPNGARVGVSSSADLVFENVFNLAVIWMIVFICLSKGIKSYGKIVVVFGIFPMITFYLIAIELLRRASSGAEFIISLNTDMSEFFFNGWSWLAAAREVFFIWGLNGFAIMQIASHNKLRHNIKRDCAIIILLTLSVLLLAAFLACACIFIIYRTQNYYYSYVPSSYETLSTSKFLVPFSELHKKNFDLRNYMTVNYLLGAESITDNSDSNTYSGYQVLRLATELYPMTVVVLGTKVVSAFWPVLFYLCLITFGLARQLAIWRCVVEGITAIYPQRLRPWETSITFLSCVFGFILGLPFATQIGAFVVHFMDICVGCVWWIMVIYLAQVFALLVVRGHPFSSDDIVRVLTTMPKMKKWLAPVISFSWNAILPITYLVLSITSFKLGNFDRMFSWANNDGYDYWPVWSKQLGALLQIIPVLLVPIVAIIQLLRYTFGQPDGGEFSERLQRLVRPAGFGMASDGRPSGDAQESTSANGSGTAEATTAGSEEARDDPPPKYTPPPSYNTATGLKLLKRLNSFRMSFRRSTRSQQRPRTEEADVEMQAAQTPEVNNVQQVFTIPQQISSETTAQVNN